MVHSPVLWRGRDAKPLPTSAAVGFRLSFSRPGDAHIDCDAMKVDVDVVCDTSASPHPSQVRYYTPRVLMKCC